MRAFTSSTLVLILIVVVPVSSAGDELETTRGEPIREVAHTVGVEVEDGVATYTVRRAFHNYGERADQVYLEIELPYGAAATGLRIRAGDTWYRGELMKADEAREKYEELTGVGTHEPKDPALLEWAWEDRLRLHVFPVFAGTTSTVEYELTVPTRYEDGTYLLTYPKSGESKKLANPSVMVRPSSPGASVEVAGAPVQPGAYAEVSPESVRNPCSWFAASRASCVTAELEVGDAVSSNLEGETTVHTELDVRHTYRGDLAVRLKSPGGEVWPLHDSEGGSENGLKVDETREFSAETDVAGTWRLFVADELARDKGSVEDWSLVVDPKNQAASVSADHVPVFLPDASRSATGEGLFRIEVGTEIEDRVEGRLGGVSASSDEAFSRLELDVAEKLSELPEDASFVFVADASHSVPDRGIEAQIDIARAMLHHVPNAHYEVVAFRRKPERVHGRFASAKRAATALGKARETGAFERGNGSSVNRALSEAAEILEDRPDPKFLVLLTDTLFHSDWTVERAVDVLSGLEDETTAHVVVPEVGSGTVEAERDDEHDLTPIAGSHGGILMHVREVPTGKTSRLRELALGLVRPVRIANIDLEGLPLGERPESLDEGEGVRRMVPVDQAPERVTLKGELWSTPYRKTFHVRPRFSRATAGFVFSHSMHHGLSDDEMLRVARFGGAVSPVTSYLAVEPGVRPSTIGIERRGAVGLGGKGGVGAGGGVGHGPLDLDGILRPVVEDCLASHSPPSDWTPTYVVESTRDEIVDVELEPQPSEARSAATCIVEETWSTRLPEEFEMKRRDRLRTTLPMSVR